MAEPLHTSEIGNAVVERNARTASDLALEAHWWTLAECRCGGWWVLRDDTPVRALRCPTLNLPAFGSSFPDSLCLGCAGPPEGSSEP